MRLGLKSQFQLDWYNGQYRDTSLSEADQMEAALLFHLLNNIYIGMFAD